MRWTAAAAIVGALVPCVLAGCASGETTSSAGDEAAASTGAGGSATGTSAGGGGQGGQGGGGGAGGMAPTCDSTLTPEEDACVVSDDFGVFVRNEGKPLALGTKVDPAGTMKQAIAIAVAQDKKRIYACAEEFPESVELPSGVSIFGALDCTADWAWSAAIKTQITGDTDAIGLKITTGSSETTRLADLRIAGDDASLPGGSSIALLVESATVELTRCEVVAGLAKDGVSGSDAPAASPPAGSDGGPGDPACDAQAAGGVATANPDCAVSSGGNGGDGNTANGENGTPGLPAPMSGTTGAPGSGQPANVPWSCTGGFLILTGNGSDGEAGAVGVAGAPASGLGTIGSDGWIGVPGSDGLPGVPGQGGGGGGGTKGEACAGAFKLGASGGAGGTGGCGGLPGGGGTAGGSSIALIAVNANVLLVDTTLVAKTGGHGGNGGNSQPGGPGGTGGPGGAASSGVSGGCKGGTGGIGGAGGPGGGGGGGHSIGVAYLGKAPTMTGKTMVQPGTPGGGGAEGNAGTTQGAAGQAVETLPF